MAHSESKPTHRETEREREKERKKSNTLYTSVSLCISLSFDASPRGWANLKKRKEKPSAAHHHASVAQKPHKSALTESAEVFVID